MQKATSSEQHHYINYGIYAWFVWGLAASFFFCDYFARVSPGVMAPQLMEAFHVSATGFGALSAFFYYPYLGMQIPVGLLVDRYSVRWLLTIMTLLTGVSCIIFATAPVFLVAALGRFLLGFSASFAFVSALKLASVWFDQSRFGMLAGFTQALGMLGAFVGEAPVAYSVAVLGWRPTMWVMAVIFFILAFAIGIVVRDYPKNQFHLVAHHRADHSIWKSLIVVLKNPQSWLNAFYAGMVFAPTAAFAELWGVEHLVHFHHLSHNLAAIGNGMIFLGWGVGGPIVGWISDYIGQRRPVMLVSALLSGIFITAALFVPGLPSYAILLLLFLYGIANTGVAISYAVASEINPRQVSGTSMAFANMMSVVPGAMMQPIIGRLLDYHSGYHMINGTPVYTASDFSFAMMSLPVALLIAVVLTFCIKETYCRVVS